MGVFFFDCHDGRAHHVDACGIDLRSEAEAGEQADALAHALMGEGLARGIADAVWVSVRSGAGLVVYTARLGLSRDWAAGGPELGPTEEREA